MTSKPQEKTTYGSFIMPDYKKLISKELVAKIREVEYFQDSMYSELAISATLDFFTKRYVRQLYDFTQVTKDTVIVDAGAGFGWLSMALAFTTDASIISIDADENRVIAGQEMAKLMGLDHKITWKHGSIGNLPLEDKVADVVYCVEVLEHVYRDKKAIPDLKRTSKDLVILTTPNLWFPAIAHDTQLPFCHWLPRPMRIPYARLFNRTEVENDNLFWSPIAVLRQMKGFKPISKWLHYKSLDRFKETFPFYLPYGSGRHVKELGKVKGLYYEIASRFGMFSHYISPSLSYVFKRVEK
ncbi:MAG: class I SAM-dependent methyltransferase [Bacteroidales bacterium]|nr:class I SAM-dependent methyltransferase [Bacteroidales bacterium]MCF8405822.1 class I SAM-dependent methyltransferase [Bacteroidales bacterium]